MSITIQFERDEDAEQVLHIRLQYTVTDTETGEKTEYDYPVPLEYTECDFGDVRPWFRCLEVVDSET